MKCISNFKIAEETSVSLSLQNRAFQYGDGLFETMLYRNGQVCFLNDHIERLLTGAQVLHMQLPDGLNAAYLQESIAQLVHINQLVDSARIRLQVCRKPGGLYTPLEPSTEFYITVHSFAPVPSIKERVFFYDEIRLSYSVISSLKTCNALPYIMAGIAKNALSVDDMILLDMYGHIAECIASNLFWIKEGCLFTPSLQSGCIAGVMRKQIIQKAKTMAIPVSEGLFHKAEILSAEAVFCTNVAGIQVIHRIEDTVFNASKLPHKLLHNEY